MNAKDYNTCVKSYSDSLFRFCLSSTRRKDEAEDLVQIAFEKLWINRKDIDARRVKSWLFTVAHRSMIDGIRRKETEARILEGTDLNHIVEENYDSKDILEKSLVHLSDMQRQIILLRDYEGYSYDDIAKITGLSLSQVKVYLFRSRKKLRAIICNMEKINYL